MKTLAQRIVAMALAAALAAGFSTSAFASADIPVEGPVSGEVAQSEEGTPEPSAATGTGEDAFPMEDPTPEAEEDAPTPGTPAAPEASSASGGADPETPASPAANPTEEDLLALAREDGRLAAERLAAVEEQAAYDVLLHAVLALYYSEEDLESQFADFTAAIDSRADEALALFRAAEERTEEKDPGDSFGEILVVFEEEVTQKEATRVIEEQDGEVQTVDDAIEDGLVAVADIAPGQTVEEAIEQLDADPAVAYAQPVFQYETAEVEPSGAEAVEIETAALTADPLAGKQWHLSSVNTSGAWSSLSALPARGKVRVAVIDTYVDLSHEDLQTNLNKDLARDMYKNINIPLTAVPSATNSHGTHVAGILGATANNGRGGTGVGTGANNSFLEIVPINVFDTSGDRAYTPDVARAIRYAADNGCKVINMSLGYNGYAYQAEDAVVESAVNYAYNKGAVVVCAAGNSGSQSLFYPGDFGNAFSVINLSSNTARSYDSNFGAKKDISAPGSNILSTVPHANNYGYMGGTSMAAPVVSAAAAMVYYVNASLSASQVEGILAYTATDLYSSGKDVQSGWGRVNAGAAVGAALANLPATASFKGVSRSYNSVNLSWSRVSAANGYYIYRSTSTSSFSLIKTIPSAATTSFTDTGRTTGTTYNYRLVPYKTVNGRNMAGYRLKSVSVKPKVAAVATVKAKRAGYSKIKVSWSKSAGATGYYVYRATKKSGSYTKIKTITKGSTRSYTDKDRVTGKKYYYKVIPFRKVSGTRHAGISSKVVNATATLAKVSGVKATGLSGKQVQLKWKKVSGATGYKILRATKESGKYKVIKTVKKGSARTYTDVGLKKGKKYHYKVVAIRKKGKVNTKGSASVVRAAKAKA